LTKKFKKFSFKKLDVAEAYHFGSSWVYSTNHNDDELSLDLLLNCPAELLPLLFFIIIFFLFGNNYDKRLQLYTFNINQNTLLNEKKVQIMQNVTNN
jgi:hypothetical protein